MKRLVLLGGGHAHLEVLRQAAARRFARTDVLLVSPFAQHHYSGMVPGFLQRTYTEHELAFDLPALCHAAGAQFRQAYAERVDTGGRWVEVDGTLIECDLVSADVGSAPAGVHDIAGVADHALTVRPMTRAIALERRLASAVGDGVATTVCVVGGGAAGVEVALAAWRRLRGTPGGANVTLIDRSETLLPEYPEKMRQTLQKIFAARGIRLCTADAVQRVTADAVILTSGESLPSTLTVWLTGAEPTSLTAASTLPKDERGFWLVDETLRSVGGGAVWGAGDCISMRGYPSMPKAGVYAVRQAPVLAANLRTASEGGADPSVHRYALYAPQRQFLAILNTADHRALLRWRMLTVHARWAWWLKDAIDQRFMLKYQSVADSGTPTRPLDGDSTPDVEEDSWVTSVKGLRTRGVDAVTLIDVRSAREYRRGHIPGAVRVSWLRYRDGWGRTGTLPVDLGAIARDMADMGVDSTRPVVVYGKTHEGWGEEGRVAWMLRYLGHPNATILDGGWPAWRRAQGEVTQRASTPSTGDFIARPRAEVRASADDVARAPAAGISLLDTRSAAEWNGSRKYWPARTGRIPGAVHLEWRDLLTPDGFIDRSPALRERLRRLGLTPERPVIAYCVGGVRSGQAFMVLHSLGFRDVRNYDGSWYAWAADDRRPIVSGAGILPSRQEG